MKYVSDVSGCTVNVVPQRLHLNVLLPTISKSFEPHFGHEYSSTFMAEGC